ncbi:MAG TPA: TIGR03936 family radical SAM-associated protein, partial [Vicinamibacteria bacterium]
RKVAVTVSVSSHVPKPHTPFQWCAQDSMEEIERKQSILRRESRRLGFTLKTHDHRVSHLEGIVARGDYRTGSLIERAWRKGARFDGWDEHLRWDLWVESLDEWEKEEGTSRATYLATLPVDGRLPWDHVDVGLEPGFLAREYRRALEGRFSPPCGKPVHAKVHHTNLLDARADERKLVCYHCGVACDLTAMREERLVFLEKMGAEAPPSRTEEPNVRERAHERLARGLSPHDFSQGEPVRYRLRYGKTGPMSLRGHLDFIRVIARVLRRARLPLFYTEGFSPHPLLSFGPALGLGIQSVAEYADVSLTLSIEGAELWERFAAASEPGLSLFGARRLSKGEPALAARIDAVDYLVALPEGDFDHGARLQSFLSAPAFAVEVSRKGKLRTVDAKGVVLEAELARAGEHGELLSLVSSDPALRLRVRETSGVVSLRPAELVKAIFGTALPPHAFVRTACGARGMRVLLDPLEALSIDEVSPSQGTGVLPDSTVLSPTT